MFIYILVLILNEMDCTDSDVALILYYFTVIYRYIEVKYY